MDAEKMARELLGPKKAELAQWAYDAQVALIVQALHTARREVWEEAAKVADAEHRANSHSVALSLGSEMRAATAHKIATAIRARAKE